MLLKLIDTIVKRFHLMFLFHKSSSRLSKQLIFISFKKRFPTICRVSERMLGANGRYVVRRAGCAVTVTGESFELLRGVSPQLDAAWGTASARMKMVLEAEPLHQTPTWERLITAALEEAADRNAYMAYPAEAHQEDVVERGPIDDPTGDSGQPVPGTELPEAEEMEQEELDKFVLPGMTDAEQLRKKEWLQIPRQARQALQRLHHMLGHKPKQSCDRCSRQAVHHQSSSQA